MAQGSRRLLSRIRAKKATIVLPGIGTINGDDPTSELLLNVLGAIAQFERQIMLARQREGIAKAKADGKYKGRAPTARSKAEHVQPPTNSLLPAIGMLLPCQ